MHLTPSSPTRMLGDRIGSMLTAVALSLGVAIAFAAAYPEQVHWFLAPLVLCGALIGVDGVEWASGRRGLFDPAGILGVLGFHFFCLAPLLHLHWDYWLSYVAPPGDWRVWLGMMAWINALGLLLYRIVVDSRSRVEPPATRRGWILDERRFWPLLIGLLALTAVLQAWVYWKSGGILGYITNYTERAETGGFRGMGMIFMVSESFPILAMMGYVALVRRRGRIPGWVELAVVIALFVALKLLFGGLRGSRSNTIWGAFWAAGMITFWVRQIPRKVVGIGLVAMLGFMYVYGFYKSGGLDALQAVGDREARSEMENRSGRSFQSTLLTDLGRSDIQAFLLHQSLRPDSDYENAWGRTYVGSVSLLIPRSIWPGRPPTKVREGTEIQYGAGSYAEGTFSSSRVYGMSGELLLNFGALAIPFGFLVLGWLVRRVQRLGEGWAWGDARLLFLPFLVNLCFYAMVADSDNVLFFFIKNGTLPLLLLWAASRRGPVALAAPRVQFGPMPAPQAPGVARAAMAGHGAGGATTGATRLLAGGEG